MRTEPPTVVYVVKVESALGSHIRTAGGTHSTPGSFFLTEAGARKACWGLNASVLKGEITWEEL